MAGLKRLNEVKAEGPDIGCPCPETRGPQGVACTRGETWIEDFRKKHGLTRAELAQLAGVSPALIGILEDQNRAITHPQLANQIAEICGATAAQRDGIVHPKHRGTWKPSRKPADIGRLLRLRKPRPKPEKPKVEVPDLPKRPAVQYGSNRRAVVALDREGRVLARYESIMAAGMGEGRNLSCVAMRCARKVAREWNRNDRTYRYADEWDAMNAAQRTADMAGRYSRARDRNR